MTHYQYKLILWKNKDPVWAEAISESHLKTLVLNVALKSEWDLHKQEWENSSLGREKRMEVWIKS